ncbi:MAG: hypothetical protein MUF83_00375 [Acidimicrobiales bacterium]|jgi:hypothetical protein|nr:hypothetical protein [Acidimicrobiales bacterium]
MAVHVNVGDATVEIKIDGWDSLWALSKGLTLGLDEIVSASVQPAEDLRKQLSWRVGGTYFPGRVAAGWYLVPDRPGTRQLLSVYRDPEVLVIETTRDSPCRVVLQLPDRHDIAWFIGERLAARG